MLKEAVLFVASTGLLIYFVTPSEEPAKPESVNAGVEKKSKPAAQSPDNAWGYEEDLDEEDDVDVSYTFGEPMTSLGDNNDKNPDGSDDDEQYSDDDDGTDSGDGWDDSASSSTSYAKSNQVVSPKSPKPGQRGSIQNPVVFKTNNPEDPVDD